MITRKRVTAMIAALLVCVGFILPMPAHAATLTYWYSTGSQIGKWTYSPVIYYCKLSSDANFSFANGIYNAVNQWNTALGTSLTYSSTNTSAPIKYYGGTIEELNREGFGIATDDENTLGSTTLSKNSKGQHFFTDLNGNSRTCSWYNIYSAVGYVIYRPETAGLGYYTYIKTTTHEVGHAMGWLDHPPNSSGYASWVMIQGIYSNTTIKTGEKNHLAQMYP